MFYDQSQIDSNLCCQSCSSKFETPRILPCGETVCENCTDKITETAKKSKYTCPMCTQTHEIPKGQKSFPVNRQLLNILQQKPYEVLQSDLFKKFKANLASNKEKLEKLSVLSSKDGVERIVKDHCIKLRSEVVEACNLRISSINQLKEKLIQKINEYETQCLKKDGTDAEEENSDRDLKQISELMTELTEFNSEWNAYLKQGKIDEEKIKEANNSVLKLHSKIEMELIDVNKDIFNFTSCKFKRSSQGFIQDDFLGSLEIKQLDGYKENLERKKRIAMKKRAIEDDSNKARLEEEKKKADELVKPKSPRGVMSSLDSVSIKTNGTDKSKFNEIERVSSSQLKMLEINDDAPSDPLMTNYNSFGYSKPNPNTKLPKVIRVSEKGSDRRGSDDTSIMDI